MTAVVQKKSTFSARNVILILAMLAGFTAMLAPISVATVSAFMTQSLNLSNDEVGQIMGAINLGKLPMLLFVGVLADMLGGKKVMMAVAGGMGLVALTMPLAQSFMDTFIRVLLLGFFLAAVSPGAVRWLTDWFPAKDLPGVMSKFYAIMPLPAVIFTIPMMLMGSQWGWTSPYLIIAALGIPIFLFIAFIGADRPEKKKGLSAEELAYSTEGRAQTPKAPGLKDFMKALSNPSIIIVMVAWALFITTVALSPYIYQSLIKFGQVDATMVSIANTVSLAIGVLYAFFLNAKVTKWLKGSVQLVWTFGVGITVVGNLIAAFGGDLPWLVWLFGASFLPLCASMVISAILPVFYTKVAGREYVGTLVSVQILIQGLVSYGVLAISGSLINPAAPGLHAVTMLYLVPAIAAAVGLVLPWFIKRVSVFEADKQAA